jgi:hypothetical protein
MARRDHRLESERSHAATSRSRRLIERNSSSRRALAGRAVGVPADRCADLVVPGEETTILAGA